MDRSIRVAYVHVGLEPQELILLQYLYTTTLHKLAVLCSVTCHVQYKYETSPKGFYVMLVSRYVRVRCVLGASC